MRTHPDMGLLINFVEKISTHLLQRARLLLCSKSRNASENAIHNIFQHTHPSCSSIDRSLTSIFPHYNSAQPILHLKLKLLKVHGKSNLFAFFK